MDVGHSGPHIYLLFILGFDIVFDLKLTKVSLLFSKREKSRFHHHSPVAAVTSSEMRGKLREAERSYSAVTSRSLSVWCSALKGRTELREPRWARDWRREETDCPAQHDSDGPDSVARHISLLPASRPVINNRCSYGDVTVTNQRCDSLLRMLWGCSGAMIVIITSRLADRVLERLSSAA